MKRGLLGAGCCLLLVLSAAAPLSAQLAAPNAAGVSLGAVYLHRSPTSRRTGRSGSRFSAQNPRWLEKPKC
jgi:hypothetical protein